MEWISVTFHLRSERYQNLNWVVARRRLPLFLMTCHVLFNLHFFLKMQYTFFKTKHIINSNQPASAILIDVFPGSGSIHLHSSQLLLRCIPFIPMLKYRHFSFSILIFVNNFYILGGGPRKGKRCLE